MEKRRACSKEPLRLPAALTHPTMAVLKAKVYNDQQRTQLHIVGICLLRILLSYVRGTPQ
jgi:hypothetical protein